MKNLTLQMTETAVLKKPAEAASKSNVVSGNAAENNASFQAMLNKQVQAKHASAKEAQPQQNKTNEAAEKNANTAQTKSQNDESKENTENTVAQISAQKMNKLHLAKVAKDSAQALANLENKSASNSIADIDKTALVAKASENNDAEETLQASSESALSNGSTVNINGVAIVPLSIDVAKSNDAFGTAKSQEAGVSLGAEGQRNLKAEINSTVLSNVLSNSTLQNKPTAQSDFADINAEDKQSNSNWLEAMLPNAAKTAMSDDATNAKLSFNATLEAANKDMVVKESGFKDLGSKEVAMPANFQSTAANNSVTTMQAPGSSNMINAYPGKTGWDQAISQKVVWMLGAQEQSATLTLNPPELGPLQVVIHVHNDQADTTFISDNAEVRQALQDGMDNLRSKMNESGVQLGQANVNCGGQMQQQFQQARSQGRASSAQAGGMANTQTEISPNSQRIVRVANGLVDTFV